MFSNVLNCSKIKAYIHGSCMFWHFWERGQTLGVGNGPMAKSSLQIKTAHVKIEFVV